MGRHLKPPTEQPSTRGPTMKRSKVDAVVIGSGVGGLCAAARLVHQGMKVAVLERLPILGGRLSSRLVKGFRIPTGAIIVPFEGRSTFRETFDLFGLPMNVRPIEGAYRYRLSHGDYDVPTGGGGLFGMIDFALQNKEEARKLFRRFALALSWWQPSDEISFRQWLAQYTSNKSVHALFQGFCAAYIGVHAAETPAGEFFRFVKGISKSIRYGIASEGNAVLMNGLAGALAERGARIDTGAACRSILVEEGIVRGAVVEKNGKQETIEATYVISNCGPKQTVQLMGAEPIEKSYRALLEAHPHPVPVISICIASSEPPTDCACVWNFGNTRNLCFLATPSLTCPELAPAGKHLTVTYSVPPSSTPPLKFRESIQRARREIELNFPVFRKGAEIIHCATHHKNWPAMHRWPGFPMPIRTPVENLYNVGDGCMPPGTVGVEACAQSAAQVADEILKRG